MSLLGLDLQCKVAEELAVGMPVPGRKLELAVGFGTENGLAGDSCVSWDPVVRGGPGDGERGDSTACHQRGEEERAVTVMAGRGD